MYFNKNSGGLDIDGYHPTGGTAMQHFPQILGFSYIRFYRIEFHQISYKCIALK